MRISEFLKKLNEITKANGNFSFQIERLQNNYRFINIDEAWSQVSFFNTVGFGFPKDTLATDFIKKCIDAKQNVMVINDVENNTLQNYKKKINDHIHSLRIFLNWITLPKLSDNSFSLTLLHNDKNEIKINDLIKVLNWVSVISKFIKDTYQVAGEETINISSCEYGSFNLDFSTIVDSATIVIWIISFFFWIVKKVKKKNEAKSIDNKDDILLENEYLKDLLSKNGIKNNFDLEKTKINNLAEELFNNEKTKPTGYTNLNEFKKRLWDEYNEFKKEKIAEICEFKLSLNSNEDKFIEYSNNSEIKKINTEEIKKLVDNNKSKKNNEDEKK